MNFISRFFSNDGSMPHGHYYFWSPLLLWRHVVSDALIALACLIIAITLIRLLRRRKDLPFDWIYACFGIFILACGATHTMEVWAPWHPAYWFSSLLKAIAAAASGATAVLLVKLVPKLISIPSPAALQQANEALENEIAERKRTEARLAQNATLLRIAGNSARLGGWSIQMPDQTLTWSDEICAIHEVPPGYTPTLEDAIRFYPPEYRAEITSHVGACIQDGTPFDFQLEIITARQRRIWVRGIGEAVRNPEGQIIRIQGAFQDISDRKLAEAANREKETLARIAGRMTRTGAWTAEVPGLRVFWSDELCEILEYPCGDALMLSEALARHPDPSREKVTAAMNACVRDGIRFDLEVETVTATGRKIWGRVCGEAERHADGSIRRVQGAFQDISELKHGAEALRTGEQRYRSLVEATTAIVWDTPASGKFEVEQPGWAAFTGQSFEELQGWGWLNAVHPDDQAETLRVWSAAVASRGIYEIEHRLRACDQTYRDMLVRAIPIMAEDGTIRQWVGVHTDITEPKRAAERLTANEVLLRQFIQHTPAAIAMLDTRMRYVQTSERWIQDYHLTGEIIIGKSHYEIFPDAPERWKEIHQRVLAGAVERCDEDPFPRADGSTDWLQWEARPWHNAGGEIGGLIFFTQVITERKRAEEELRWKTALLEAQIDSYSVGILVVDNSGVKILQNRRTIDLFKIPPAIAEEANDHVQLQFVRNRTKYPDQFSEKVAHLFAHPSESSVDEIELIDGMVIERYSAPVTGKDGRHYGRIWTFTDITGRKRAEAERAVLNKQLVDASRQAGMAEVATSVLHNVGNVLNSVNVSATLVAAALKKSKVGALARVVTLLNQHSEDLSAFIDGDPRGKKLPEFLRQLSEQLNREQQRAITELESLRENIEHIKEIVAMQQNYAKVSGVTERLKITDLVEDSLRMNADSLLRHGINVIREYQEVPAISVEKHKIMQILVNLIRNAKHACDEACIQDKRITLRVTNGEETVTISVIDNGVGVPAENLTRIFNHGFTTRENGHGFGLHSSANAARELGGSLRAYSGGPGTGASFTLELPLVSNDSNFQSGSDEATRH
ncbi:MAG: Blue-light-activated histidine kinase [Chthoniobacteraceae bacterium]|nr:Blue-light-activated histidine kinase [Chthoniobacteraceae bacterium]